MADTGFAARDHRGFLGEHPAKVIIDETLKIPSLLSYIQTAADENGTSSRSAAFAYLFISLLRTQWNAWKRNYFIDR